MDDETSSHYIFLFVLLLIPFLVIGLSIKANIYILLLICWEENLRIQLPVVSMAHSAQYWNCLTLIFNLIMM